MKCSTWLKKDDEKVLTVLQESDKWLTAEELSEITGLPLKKVQRTLNLLKQQMNFGETHKKYLQE